MLPTTMIGASSKSYLDLPGARHWLSVVGAAIDDGEPGPGIFWCPPLPLVVDAVGVLSSRGADAGAQDVSAFGPGAYTGETHAGLLAQLGVTLVMVGHPERARHQGESPEVFAAKVTAAARAGLVPILVVGEPVRGADPDAVVLPQLERAFAGVEAAAPVVVAYEPSWAIGAAQPAPPDHVLTVVAGIRAWLAGRFGEFRVLYGGSAGPGTFAALAHAADGVQDAPDGVFLGRSGLDPQRFLDTVREVRSARRS